MQSIVIKFCACIVLHIQHSLVYCILLACKNYGAFYGIERTLYIIDTVQHLYAEYNAHELNSLII